MKHILIIRDKYEEKEDILAIAESDVFTPQKMKKIIKDILDKYYEEEPSYSDMEYIEEKIPKGMEIHMLSLIAGNRTKLDVLDI